MNGGERCRGDLQLRTAGGKGGRDLVGRSVGQRGARKVGRLPVVSIGQARSEDAELAASGSLLRRGRGR